MATLLTPKYIVNDQWLDTTDADTITLVSGVVSELRDKSGNNRHFSQGSASLRPVVTAGGLNGLDIITFASGKYLSAADWLGTSGHYIYIIGVFSTAIGRGLDGSGSGWSLRFLSTTNAIVTTNGSSSAAAYGNLTYPSGLSTIKSLLLKPGQKLEGLSDGVSVGSVTIPSNLIYLRNSTAGWNIGRSGGATLYTPGDFAESIMIVSTAGFPSAGTMRSLEGYLAHKYALTANLAGDHPYKLTAPMVRSLSGEVNANGSPAQRPVIIYANDGRTIVGETLSDPVTGAWALDGLPDDDTPYTVVFLGETGEYSKIYRHVVAG